MSNRNKHEEKQSRKDIRGFHKSAHGTTPIGRIPQEISANILSNPKQMKLSGKSRRRLCRGRGNVVVNDTKAPKNFAVRAAVKLTKLSLVQLHRRLAQTARRASTVKHLISDLSPGSMFAEQLKTQQTGLLSFFKQVAAEIRSRNHQKS